MWMELHVEMMLTETTRPACYRDCSDQIDKHPDLGGQLKIAKLWQSRRRKRAPRREQKSNCLDLKR